MLASLLQCGPTDKVVVLRAKRYGKADSRLERIRLVAEFLAGENQARFDAEQIHRRKAERHGIKLAPGLANGIVYNTGGAGVAKYFVA